MKSAILLVSDSVPEEDRDLLEDILSNKMIKKWTWWYIAYSTVLKWERNLSLHDVMIFCNLAVGKIRFIMADSHEYRQKPWNVLDLFPNINRQYKCIYLVKRRFWNWCVVLIQIYSAVHFFFKYQPILNLRVSFIIKQCFPRYSSCLKNLFSY